MRLLKAHLILIILLSAFCGSCRYSNSRVLKTAVVGRYYVEWYESSSGHFPAAPRHDYWCSLYKKGIFGRYRQVDCISSNIYSIHDTAECKIEFEYRNYKRDIRYKRYVVDVCAKTVFKYTKKGKAKQVE